MKYRYKIKKIMLEDFLKKAIGEDVLVYFDYNGAGFTEVDVCHVQLAIVDLKRRAFEKYMTMDEPLAFNVTDFLGILEWFNKTDTLELTIDMKTYKYSVEYEDKKVEGNLVSKEACEGVPKTVPDWYYDNEFIWSAEEFLELIKKGENYVEIVSRLKEDGYKEHVELKVGLESYVETLPTFRQKIRQIERLKQKAVSRYALDLLEPILEGLEYYEDEIGISFRHEFPLRLEVLPKADTSIESTYYICPRSGD